MNERLQTVSATTIQLTVFSPPYPALSLTLIPVRFGK
jgi:hypothetical protein